MSVKLLTEHQFDFLRLTDGCRGSSESTLVKISNCWKFHASARKINHEISTVNILPSNDAFKKGCFSYNRTYAYGVLVNRLFKLARVKVWLGELTFLI